MQISTRVGVVQAIGRLPYRVSEQEERKVRGAAAQAPGARLVRKEIILGAPPRRPAEGGVFMPKKPVDPAVGGPSPFPLTRPTYRAIAIPNRCACQRRWSSINVEMKK